MTQNAADLEKTFQRAWALLIANPIVVVPGLVVAGVVILIVFLVAFLSLGAVAVASATGSAAAGWSGVAIAAAIAVVLGVVAAIVQTAYVTGMAGAAWTRGTTTLADGWEAFRRSSGEIFLAVVLLVLLGIVAGVLAVFTLTLSLWAYLILFLYVMPAVVLGGLPAGRAIGESCRIAMRNFWPTVGVAAIVILVSVLAGWIGSEFARVMPAGGSILSAILEQAAVAYGTLIIVGEYLKLHPAEPLAAPSSEQGTTA